MTFLIASVISFTITNNTHSTAHVVVVGGVDQFIYPTDSATFSDLGTYIVKRRNSSAVHYTINYSHPGRVFSISPGDEIGRTNFEITIALQGQEET